MEKISLEFGDIDNMKEGRKVKRNNGVDSGFCLSLLGCKIKWVE